MIKEMDLVSLRIQTSVGELLVAASSKGLCRISFPVELTGKWFPWFDRFFSTLPKTGNHPLIQSFDKQIRQYLAKERTEFEIPLDLRGTEFQKQIWERLLKIPYGATVTYGELAREMGIPGGSRAIGGATGANPVPIVVPCHRVVGTTGNLVGFGGGIDLKERLLELEGSRIPFGN
jgi:methylated-DNA-[protein]-cysteine S-methyltransferase